MSRNAALIGLLVVSCAFTDCMAQEYRSSVVGTEFDFIHSDDPDTFLCLEYKSKRYREMPDKTKSSPLVQQGFVFVAYFSDGTSIDMAIDSDFQTRQAAEAEAIRYIPRLGKLPTVLRKGLKRMVVHKGDATAFGGDGCIILYSENATKRISTRDLEETIFHESIHASWDNDYAESKEWLAAQESDGKFVTDYARKRPDKEDLAESALFAYTLIHHPERIPQEESDRIRAAIPARIEFIKKLLPPDKPIHYAVGPKYACDGSGETFFLDKERENGETVCTVDLNKAGQMSDIISNALMRGYKFQESKVREYLESQMNKHSDGASLLKAAATEFKIEVSNLEKMVQEFKHVNCKHGPVEEKLPSAK